MRVICDIGHPAHVHLFKNLLWQLKQRGDECLVTTRAKEVTIELLKKYGIPYVLFGERYRSICGKAYGLVKFDYLMYGAARRFRPDLFISHGSIYAAHVASLLNKPHISLEDTNNMEQIGLYSPFTQTILTSTCFPKKFGRKQIRYNGYHELAYLHPHYFKPDPSALTKLGVRRDERYVIIRFVDWKATHDLRHSGVIESNKINAVKEFSRYARVFISSEIALPRELERYRITISVESIHDVLYYASLFYGESATMASECAVLGTPAVFLDDTGRYYTREQQQKYGLVYNFSESLFDQDSSIDKGIELLKNIYVKDESRMKRDRLLRDKIDVTAFLTWFVACYPRSVHIMKENPNHQLQFK